MHSGISKLVPLLQILLIILSNDVSRNSGPPFHDSFSNFMSWNVNFIAKDEFQRVRLIDAHNSIFKYDFISLCETSLNDSIKLPDILLNDYTFVHSKNPTNTRHGGVGLFYKNALPIKIRNDLSLDESIVIELNFGRKKFFFTVLYRSPAFSHNSPVFKVFLSNFTNLYSKIKNEIHTRPFLLVILMSTHSSGGLMATQLRRIGKLEIL